MSWQAYRLIYEAKSPVHVGHHTLGFIRLARAYIPGVTMWGAMTSGFARAYGLVDPGGYEACGDLFKTEVIAGYFYPAIDPDDPFVPCYGPTGLAYGKYGLPREIFERQFFGSLAQTAIIPQTFTAHEATLHEAEYLMPWHTSDDTGKILPTYFIGYLFIRQGASIHGEPVRLYGGDKPVLPAIRKLSVGGDRSTGWGQLILNDDSTGEVPRTDIFGHPFGVDADGRPYLEMKAEQPVPAHLPVTEGLSLHGDLEPLVTRRWAVRSGGMSSGLEGPGQKITPVVNGVCWKPGSILTCDAPLSIHAHGILGRSTKGPGNGGVCAE